MPPFVCDSPLSPLASAGGVCVFLHNEKSPQLSGVPLLKLPPLKTKTTVSGANGKAGKKGSSRSPGRLICVGTGDQGNRRSI